MSFRDETEALRERVRELESSLARATRELEEAERERAELPALRKRLAALEEEAGALRVGIAPRAAMQQRLAIFVGVTALVVVSGAVAFATLEGEGDAEADARSHAMTDELARAEARARVAEAELAATRAERIAEAAERDAVPEPAAAPEAIPIPELFGVPSTTIRATGRARTVEGAAPVRRGARCSIVVETQGGGECHATVDCGDESLYPRGGGGYFRCETDAEHVLRGADVNTSDVSRDPRLDLDVSRGTVVVSDGPSPEWSVTIALSD